MAVHTHSVALDDEVAARAIAAAEAEGMSLSAWLSRAASRTASLESAERSMYSPLDRYIGDGYPSAGSGSRSRPIPPEVWERAQATLDRLAIDLGTGHP
jgi:hypothetical protein